MAVSKQMAVGVVVAACLGLLVGGIIGHLGTKGVTKEEEAMVSTMQRLTGGDWDENDEINKRIVDLVDADNIRKEHKELTAKPHLAGTDRDDYLAEMIQKRFKAAGFDTSDLVPYDVLLSFPDPSNPNLITLEDAAGTVIFTSKYKEVPLEKDDADPDFIHAFNAYAPAGDVQTDIGTGLVYVNYGREEDFEKLAELGVSVTGAILIARYGKIFRGNKLLHAQQRGAKGLIIFSDPMDVALNGTAPEDVYPNSWWLPGSGMQRGTTFMGDGDPLTPGWPSTEHAYRLKEEEADLPTIPCQPIGYDDAKVILEKMGGRVAPEGWRGGLKNVAYNLGPELIGDYKLRLVTHNYIKRQRSFNVISTVKGSVEPTQRKYDVFFPYYHTGYETFYMLDKIVDPGFRITQGCSRIVGLALRYFADSHLLPFHLPQLPITMKESLRIPL